MKRHISLTLILLFCVTLGTSCVGQPHLEPNLYQLMANSPQAEPQNSQALKRRLLLIGPFSAGAVYDDLAFVYQVGPEELKTDFYNQFAAPPARLLADQTTQYLNENNKRLRAVKMTGLALADYGLDAYVEAIYGDFTHDEEGVAVIKIRFTLNDLGSAKPRVLLDKVYEERVMCAEKTPEALVAAWSLALSNLLFQVNADIEAAV